MCARDRVRACGRACVRVCSRARVFRLLPPVLAAGNAGQRRLRLLQTPRPADSDSSPEPVTRISAPIHGSELRLGSAAAPAMPSDGAATGRPVFQCRVGPRTATLTWSGSTRLMGPRARAGGSRSASITSRPFARAGGPVSESPALDCYEHSEPPGGSAAGRPAGGATWLAPV